MGAILKENKLIFSFKGYPLLKEDDISMSELFPLKMHAFPLKSASNFAPLAMKANIIMSWLYIYHSSLFKHYRRQSTLSLTVRKGVFVAFANGKDQQQPA